MKFSIIVPVYNAAAFLNATVSSVQQQSFADWELLLVDDGSTDGVTDKLCDEFAAKDNRIQAIHKPNGGAGDARNAAFPYASGDYIVFLDSDDFLEPNALSCLNEKLNSSPVDICFFGFTIQKGESETIQTPSGYPYEKPFALRDAPAQLLEAPSAWCAVWKRSLFEETNIRFRGRGWGEDLAMTRKMLTQASSIMLIEDALYRYEIHEGSITTSRNLNGNAEIMDALDDVITWFYDHNLFEAYRDELCCLCLNNIYDACVRIVKADPKHPLTDKLMAFAENWFPQYKKSSYIECWPAKRKLVLSLLEKGLYRAAQMLFRGK